MPRRGTGWTLGEMDATTTFRCAQCGATQTTQGPVAMYSTYVTGCSLACTLAGVDALHRSYRSHMQARTIPDDIMPLCVQMGMRPRQYVALFEHALRLERARLLEVQHHEYLGTLTGPLADVAQRLLDALEERAQCP